MAFPISLIILRLEDNLLWTNFVYIKIKKINNNNNKIIIINLRPTPTIRLGAKGVTQFKFSSVRNKLSGSTRNPFLKGCQPIEDTFDLFQ